MFCRQCGTLNAENAPTCTSCGNALTANPYGGSAVQGLAGQGAGVPGGMPMEGKPKNYLVESILVTFCCCLPLGIVGIVYASQVDSKWNFGDHAGAVAAADNAKKFTIIGLAIGLVLNLLVFGVQILAIMGAANQGGNF